MKRKLLTASTALVLAVLMIFFSFPAVALGSDDTPAQTSGQLAEGSGSSASGNIHIEEGDFSSGEVIRGEVFPDYLFEDIDEPASLTNAFGGAASTRATYWFDNITIEENDDYIIPNPTPDGRTLSWYVSDPEIADIDISTGQIYGLKAGTAYVTAADTANNFYRCQVLVRKPDGVYKLMNADNDYYIELSNGDISEGADYIQWSLENNRNSKFKLQYLGNAQYAIRSMVANNVGLKRSSDGYLENSVIDPSSNLQNIEAAELWMIRYTEEGYYYIHNASGSNYTITPTSSGIGTNCRYSLSTYYGYLNQQFIFERQTTTESGVDIRNSVDSLCVGDDFQFSATMYSYIINANGQHDFIWSITSGTANATIASNGRLVANSPGFVTVSVRYAYANNLSWSTSCTVYIKPLENGTYFLRNAQWGGYLTYSETQAQFEVADFDGLGHQSIALDYVGDGYYVMIMNFNKIKLITEYNNGLRLSLYDEENQVMTDNQKWRITLDGNGRYKLSPKSNGNKYLSAGDINNASGNRTLVVSNSQSNYSDEWYFRSNIATAYTIGGEFNDVDAIADDILKCGLYSNRQRNPSKAWLEANSGVLNSDVVFFSSHGTQHYIYFENNHRLSDGNEPLPSANTVNITNYDISGAKLYVYGACSTAEGGTNNLCQATLNAGVDCVVAWTQEPAVDDFDKWRPRFLEALIAGSTVSYAVAYANSFNDYFRNEDALKSCQAYGNGNITINDAVPGVPIPQLQD